MCHYCGVVRRVPETCPVCSGTELIELGAGTQQIEELVASYWPEARVARLDRDTANSAGMQQLLGDFAEGRADILVGTQMVAKGHHFPGLTVVGVISADDALNIPDYRGGERCFQTIVQVAGRAGRTIERPGTVYIQSRNPHHPVLQAAVKGDYEGFAQAELAERESAGFPPFRRLALIKVSARAPNAAEAAASLIASELKPHAARAGVDMLGPAPAPIERLRGYFRYHILLRGPGPSPSPLAEVLRGHFDAAVAGAGKDLRVAVDVDPVSLV